MRRLFSEGDKTVITAVCLCAVSVFAGWHVGYSEQPDGRRQTPIIVMNGPTDEEVRAEMDALGIPPPKPPKRPEPQWYPFADVKVQQSNAWTFDTAQADGWSYGDRELINQIVSEQEPGTKFTLYHLKDSHYLAWSFAGRSRQTNVRAFLYGVHYVFPDGSERDEFRLHGSLPISTWQVKWPRSYVEEATNEELNL